MPLNPHQQVLSAADSQARLSAALIAHGMAPSGDGAAAAAADGSPLLLSARTSTGSLEAAYLDRHSSAAWELLHEVVTPVFILLLGVGFSVAALWVAIAALLPKGS